MASLKKLLESLESPDGASVVTIMMHRWFVWRFGHVFSVNWCFGRIQNQIQRINRRKRLLSRISSTVSYFEKQSPKNIIKERKLFPSFPEILSWLIYISFWNQIRFLFITSLLFIFKIYSILSDAKNLKKNSNYGRDVEAFECYQSSTVAAR